MRHFSAQAPFSRRSLLHGATSLLAAPACSIPKGTTGSLGGPNAALGHKAHAGGLPDKVLRKSVVIIGGGIAGLSAGRQLLRKGNSDFIVLELESIPGGNSRSGQNNVSPFPLGAHYVPLLNPDLQPIRELFEQYDIIQGYEGELPIYNELYLCAEPVERLFIYGQWQDGLFPTVGLTVKERAQVGQFRDLIAQFKQARGNDGRPAFTIPVDSSSLDPSFTALDQVSMVDFLVAQGITSPKLHWYVNYCCRDDFGIPAKQTSAWAGLHYFASRRGQAANAPKGSVLTWPEGNGWLVQQMAKEIANHLECQSAVTSIRNTTEGVEVDYLNAATGEMTRVLAQAAVCCLPQKVADKVVHENPPSRSQFSAGIRHSPWLVANVTLRRPPADGKGAALAWDNVSFHGRSLGYVVANHQKISLFRDETVITLYQPLDEFEPSVSRQIAGALRQEDWSRIVLRELEGVHPGITRDCLAIDHWLIAHGMVSPFPGTIWGKGRTDAQKPSGSIFFAHSDLSGISIFEEAFLRGYDAANAALARARRSAT